MTSYLVFPYLGFGLQLLNADFVCFFVGTFSGMLSTILLHRASALHGNMCLAALSGQRQLYRSTSFIFEFSSFRSYAFQPTGLESLSSISVLKKQTALAISFVKEKTAPAVVCRPFWCLCILRGKTHVWSRQKENCN